MSQHLNRVVVTGNLTKDPELRELPSGTSVCKLRIAVNNRRKTSDGEWEDRPGFYDVIVWGRQGEAAAEYLSKGIAGRDRRSPRLARVADGGRAEAPERRDRRRGGRGHLREGATTDARSCHATRGSPPGCKLLIVTQPNSEE